MTSNQFNFIVILVLLSSLFVCPLTVIGEDIPIIASRISDVTEISIIDDIDLNKPNNTLFRINTTVEILNRCSENYTVYENADYYPKIVIGASFVNKSLDLEPRIISFDMGVDYTYAPALTTEYESLLFYINQSDLSYLPDGNYTVLRPISTLYPSNSELLPVQFQVSSGVAYYVYANFTNLTIPSNETASFIYSTLTGLLISSLLMIIRRAYKKNDRKT